jgi:hypothetical protein
MGGSFFLFRRWVQGLASQLTEKSYVVTDDFLERELAVKLAVEVRKAWSAGRLTTGKLGGGRTGKNTRCERTCTTMC